ncbi:MAG: hypothetical protein KHX36_13100, partial [Clostridiales bacterium]|nr:hypothetical protein [Clostridiales bacterium]
KADSGLSYQRRYVYYTTVLQGIKGKERKWPDNFQNAAKGCRGMDKWEKANWLPPHRFARRERFGVMMVGC